MKKRNYFKKEYGQNFLINHRFAIELIDAVDIDNNDIIVEVGPGEGMLTQYYVNEVKHALAVEIDDRFVGSVRKAFKGTGIQVVNKDILEFDPSKYHLRANGYKLIGSLPYNISKLIISKFLEEDNHPSDMSVLVQKEVGYEYCAEAPNSSFLSNYVQLYSDREFIEVVPKEFFRPEPEVDGAIIKFSNIKRRYDDADKFEKFLKSAFLNPRKKLINNLANVFRIDKDELKKIYKKIGITLNSRAEEIEFENWRELFEAIKK